MDETDVAMKRCRAQVDCPDTGRPPMVARGFRHQGDSDAVRDQPDDRFQFVELGDLADFDVALAKEAVDLATAKGAVVIADEGFGSEHRGPVGARFGHVTSGIASVTTSVGAAVTTPRGRQQEPKRFAGQVGPAQLPLQRERRPDHQGEVEFAGIDEIEQVLRYARHDP